jgi:hypothetical protein
MHRLSLVAPEAHSVRVGIGIQLALRSPDGGIAPARKGRCERYMSDPLRPIDAIEHSHGLAERSGKKVRDISSIIDHAMMGVSERQL